MSCHFQEFVKDMNAGLPISVHVAFTSSTSLPGANLTASGNVYDIMVSLLEKGILSCICIYMSALRRSRTQCF